MGGTGELTRARRAGLESLLDRVHRAGELTRNTGQVSCLSTLDSIGPEELTRYMANCTLWFLRRNLHDCTRDIKHIAYNTLVRPTLEYCSVVWDPHTRRNIGRLEQMNTKAVRFITDNYTQAPGITTHLKQQINMDPLHIRRQAHRLTLLYKIKSNYIDIDPHTYLHNTNNQRTHNTHSHTYQTYTNTDSFYLRFCTLRPRVSEADFLPQPTGGAVKFLYSGTS